MPAPRSDFLEPTLGAKDDFAGFQDPFQPQWTAFVGFLGGPLVAGVLLGLNHVKLGGSRWIALAWLLACLLLVFPLWVLAGLWGRVALGGVVVGSLLLHGRRYRVYAMSGGEQRVNWWLGIAIILGGRFLTRFAVYGVVLALYLVLGEEGVREFFEAFGVELSEPTAGEADTAPDGPPAAETQAEPPTLEESNR